MISTDSLSEECITLLSLTLTSFKTRDQPLKKARFLNVGIGVLGQERTCFIVSKFEYQPYIE